ncbi:hypothetical protein AOC05_17750 [Arthrobacter alpinus]|uniref:Uncharacterized protein n=2 Tax=Arthrobacter TaxID=1663 RepID=A0A0M4RRA1_9MICC|nr:hypothetical protein AOC05_17750 [Arthrobacter alpinus]
MEEEIRELVLGVDGVAIVYSADPLWLTVLKQVGAALSPVDDPAQLPFVVCLRDDDGGRQIMRVQVRIGTNGAVPAPALARNVAAAIRVFVSARQPEVGVVAAVEVAAIGV